MRGPPECGLGPRPVATRPRSHGSPRSPQDDRQYALVPRATRSSSSRNSDSRSVKWSAILFVFRRRGCRARPQDSPQHHARAVQLRLRGPRRNFQQHRDLAVLVALHVVQDENLSRAVRQAWRSRFRNPWPGRRVRAGPDSSRRPARRRATAAARTASVRNRSITTFTASRCSQVPNDESPRNVESFCQAARRRPASPRRHRGRPSSAGRACAPGAGACDTAPRTRERLPPRQPPRRRRHGAVGRPAWPASARVGTAAVEPHPAETRSSGPPYPRQLGRMRGGRKVGTASGGYRRGRCGVPSHQCFCVVETEDREVEVGRVFRGVARWCRRSPAPAPASPCRLP